jgi:prevent-host-death family protein
MESFTVAQARERFAEVLDHATVVPVEITRHGRPTAYIVSPTMFEKLTSPDFSSLLNSADVTPASVPFGEWVDQEPLPREGSQSLGEILEEMRQDRL